MYRCRHNWSSSRMRVYLLQTTLGLHFWILDAACCCGKRSTGIKQGELRRSGLTPAFGSAHALNDQGCHGRTEAVNATLRTVKGCKTITLGRRERSPNIKQKTQTFFVAVCTAAALNTTHRMAAAAAAPVGVLTTAAALLVRIYTTTSSSSCSTTTNVKP